MSSSRAAAPLDVAAIRAAAVPMHGGDRDWDSLLQAIPDDATVVLLGEASHGTREFYEARAAITRRLITERGFGIVALEADFPSAAAASRYVTGRGSPGSDAVDALSTFRGRWPAWMWYNASWLDFLGWLKDYNDKGGRRRRGGAPCPR